MDSVSLIPMVQEVPPLEGALADKAKWELNETADKRSPAVLELRKWFMQHHEGLLPRDDDAFLLRFLRARKFDMQRTQLLLKHYSEFRKTQADLFKVTADELADVLGKGIVAVLPQRDKNGCTIVLVRSGQIKLEETPFKVLLRALIYICEKLIEDFTVQINGIVIVYDFAGYPLGLVTAIQSAEKTAAMQWTENCFPIRFGGAHLVNQPWYMTFFLSIVRMFSSKKILSRVFLHGRSLPSLHQDFDASLLPTPYGTLENFDPLAAFESDIARLRDPNAVPTTVLPEVSAAAAPAVPVQQKDPNQVVLLVTPSKPAASEPATEAAAAAAAAAAVPAPATAPEAKPSGQPSTSTNPFDD